MVALANLEDELQWLEPQTKKNHLNGLKLFCKKKKKKKNRDVTRALVESVIKRTGGRVKHSYKCFYSKELKSSLSSSFPVLKVKSGSEFQPMFCY